MNYEEVIQAESVYVMQWDQQIWPLKCTSTTLYCILHVHTVGSLAIYRYLSYWFNESTEIYVRLYFILRQNFRINCASATRSAEPWLASRT